MDELIKDGGAFGLAVLVGVVALALGGLNSIVVWKQVQVSQADSAQKRPECMRRRVDPGMERVIFG